MNLYLALETTGAWQWRLPDDDDAQPHVVRVAAILEDGSNGWFGDLVRLVQPEADWVFEDGAVKSHGIDWQTATDLGKPVAQVIGAVDALLPHATRLIGFGLDFQLRALRSLHGGAPLPVTAAPVCCMKLCRDVVKKPSMRPVGGYAVPSFAEAYWHFTGQSLPTVAGPIAAGYAKIEALRTIYLALTKGDRA